MERSEESSHKRKGKFRSTRRKNRKGFLGKKAWEIRTTNAVDSRHETSDEQPSTSQDEGKDASDLSSPRNMSELKLKNSSFKEFEGESGVQTRSQTSCSGMRSEVACEQAHGFKLQDVELLSQCISTSAICSLCRDPGSKLQLFQENNKRDGLAESLYLECSSCGCQTPLKTSKRLGGKGGGAHEVNRRSVLSSHRWGRAGLTKFCAGMELAPPVTKKAYNQHMMQVEKIAVGNAEELMCEAAERLRNLISNESEDNEVEIDGHTVTKVAVTIDGTWQKRGHSSKIGVVFAVSVRTGEILDYVVKSLLCKECSCHEKLDKQSHDYLVWKETHKNICQVNHKGSSEEMEALGAIEMFSRSIEKRKLMYSTFVGDGDSSCFGKVAAKMKEQHGESYVVVKEECVGHVQKRLGTALRNYKRNAKGQKLSDGKTVGGKGRLTDKVIDQMQNYYGKAIRDNSGNIENMKKSIWAIYNHMIRDETACLEKQHQLCPMGEDSWCKFWRDKANGTSTYNDERRLPHVFLLELKPIFVRLSKDDLLQRCLQGLTQNQNESVNGQLWAKCPKNRYCGKRRVVIAVCETVGVFNTGAASKATLMKSCGVSPGRNMLKALRKEDHERIVFAVHKVSSYYRKKRQELWSQKKSKADKLSYQAGAFGISCKPESKGKKARAPSRKTKSAVATAVASTSSEIEIILLSLLCQKWRLLLKHINVQ